MIQYIPSSDHLLIRKKIDQFILGVMLEDIGTYYIDYLL